MKKFQFPLQKVLTYREQIEENLKTEQAQILASIAKEEGELRKLEEEYQAYCLKMEDVKREGCKVQELFFFEGYLKSVDQKAKRKEQVLIDLRRKEERKRQEVIVAKTNRTSIEQLKEKRVAEYNHEVQKAEEVFIDEFVSNTKAKQLKHLG